MKILDKNYMVPLFTSIALNRSVVFVKTIKLKQVLNYFAIFLEIVNVSVINY